MLRRVDRPTALYFFLPSFCVFAPPISKAIWWRPMWSPGACWNGLLDSNLESRKTWRHNSFLSDLAASEPMGNQELFFPMPRMQENSPEKNHEKCQKSRQKHWVVDLFFSSKTAKNNPSAEHRIIFRGLHKIQKKPMELMETFPFFLKVFLNDLGSRRFCCSIFWGSTKKS